MRLNQPIFDAVESGELIGTNRPCGRVTIEPDWKLNSTNVPAWGNSIRGPFRWYQNMANNQTEIEVPNIKSISIDRTLSQDIATCKIEIFNQVHDDVSMATPELNSQLGKPGYFWPDRGNPNAVTLWNQAEAKGGYTKGGTWQPNFSWKNCIVPHGLIRTYQGYGGHNLSISSAITAENIEMTGVWLIDTVTASTDGILSISCRDIGRLLLDQLIFPPLIPPALYPLEYYPPGKSAFDSHWDPKGRNGVYNANEGKARLYGHAQSSGNAQLAVDGKWSTYAISDPHPLPSSPEMEWFQFRFDGSGSYNVEKKLDKLVMKPWAGGYTVYVSIFQNGGWVGGTTIPGATGPAAIPYVKEQNIPLAIPDGQEPISYIQLTGPGAAPDNTYNAVQYVRLTFKNYYYSNIGGGDQYRCGIRDLQAYDVYPGNFPTYEVSPSAPWTHTMAAHPTRGYWVCDDNGWVYGFGDAAEYDSDAFGQVILSSSAIGMAAHPSGEGYWVLLRDGRVTNHGAPKVGDFGEHVIVPGADPFGMDGVQAMDIAATYTGNGYWVIYSNGVVYGFGDAVGAMPSNPLTLPQSNVDTFMSTVWVDTGFPPGSIAPRYPYPYARRGTAIAGHPHELGFWASTGSGEVYAYGAAKHKGQLINRTYNEGMANSFSLAFTEFCHGMASTVTGEGYWIAFGSGHVAAFGDAVGQGPVDVYAKYRPDVEISPYLLDSNDFDFFKAIIWDIAPDPDGKGFWLLAGDGGVGGFEAEFWGQPGFYGLSGYRWHDGNYKDYSDIVKELLLWSGFLAYNSSQPSNVPPPVYGNIESTAIMSDTILPGTKFDKRTVIDAIKEFKEIVGYNFYIDEEGAAHFESPNWWRAGNFDDTGVPIYVTYDIDGNWTRVYPDINGNYPVGAEPFIPTIHEAVDMHNYSASLDGDSLRSELIIGTDQPDPKDPTRTGYVRFTPPSAADEVRPGIPALRGIQRPAMWINKNFENPEEQMLMAELIALQIWFSQRTGQVTCTANPNITINDQVQLIERNTSETYTHYVRAINTEMDLDSGTYTMTLTTNWLGNADDWVITAEDIYEPMTHVKITERLDRWLALTQRELPTGGSSTAIQRAIITEGDFTNVTTPVPQEATPLYTPEWTYVGSFSAPNGVTDLTFTLNQYSSILGTGAGATPTGADFEIRNSGNTLMYSGQLPVVGNTITIGNLAAGDYTVTFTGTPTGIGNASISVTVDGSNIDPALLTGSTILVSTPSNPVDINASGFVSAAPVFGTPTSTSTLVVVAYNNAEFANNPTEPASKYQWINKGLTVSQFFATNVEAFGQGYMPVMDGVVGGNYLSSSNFTATPASLDLRMQLKFEPDAFVTTAANPAWKAIAGRWASANTLGNQRWILFLHQGQLKFVYMSSGNAETLHGYQPTLTSIGFVPNKFSWLYLDTNGLSGNALNWYTSDSGNDWTLRSSATLSTAMKTDASTTQPIFIGSSNNSASNNLYKRPSAASVTVAQFEVRNQSTKAKLLTLDAQRYVSGNTWSSASGHTWTVAFARTMAIRSTNSIPSVTVPNTTQTKPVLAADSNFLRFTYSTGLSNTLKVGQSSVNSAYPGGAEYGVYAGSVQEPGVYYRMILRSSDWVTPVGSANYRFLCGLKDPTGVDDFTWQSWFWGPTTALNLSWPSGGFVSLGTQSELGLKDNEWRQITVLAQFRAKLLYVWAGAPGDAGTLVKNGVALTIADTLVPPATASGHCFFVGADPASVMRGFNGDIKYVQANVGTFLDTNQLSTLSTTWNTSSTIFPYRRNEYTVPSTGFIVANTNEGNNNFPKVTVSQP